VSSLRRLLPKLVGGATAVLVALLAPSPAAAHLVTTGLGPVYDGVTHLLVTFDDLLPVLALAMLAGLHGPGEGRRALFLLPSVWLAAGAIGFAAGKSAVTGSATASSLLVLGGLTASGWRLPPAALTALVLAVGVLHGGLNGVDLVKSGREGSALCGIAAAVFVVVALVAAFVCRLRAPWTRIAVRVAGSWIAAIGLLLAGWALR
jgi:urease accessory protein